MQYRCSLQINQRSKKLVLTGQDNETPENMALKLAAAILFFDMNPIVDVSMKHPQIIGQEFRPDLLCLTEFGETAAWIECGNVTTHKLDKLLRRNRNARIIVVKSSVREARNLRNAFEKNDVANSDRAEIYAFPDGVFDQWLAIMDESVDVIGESEHGAFNLVANAGLFDFRFERI